MTIRRVPEDFRVREELGAEFLVGLSRERRAHAVYELEKKGLTTPDACAGLARAMGVRAGAVQRAGLKDMHALTTQWVSVELGRAETAPERAEGKSWSAALRGWSARAIGAEDIARNRFEIVVRDLSADAAEEMGRRIDVLRAGDGLEIVNYFGEQRFGSARRGKGLAGAHLVRGEFEQALRLLIGTPARKESGKMRAITRPCAEWWGDWHRLVKELPVCAERGAVEVLAGGGGFREAFAALPYLTQSMAVDAYASSLWNRAACTLVRGCGAGVDAEDPFGVLLFPETARVTEELRACVMPLPSPEMTLSGVWGGAMGEVLAKEGLTPEGLVVPGLRRPVFRSTPRRLMVRAGEFTLSGVERDEMAGTRVRFRRSVGFWLPSGSYATVVLRALGQ